MHKMLSEILNGWKIGLLHVATIIYSSNMHNANRNQIQKISDFEIECQSSTHRIGGKSELRRQSKNSARLCYLPLWVSQFTCYFLYIIA